VGVSVRQVRPWSIGPEGILVENASEQEAIRLMRQLRADGSGYEEIAGLLDETGIKPKQSRVAWLVARLRAVFSGLSSDRRQACREWIHAKKKARLPVSEALRQAIQDSGLSLYRVAKGADIGYASLHRFMSGEWAVSLDVFDRLCESLGLDGAGQTRGLNQRARHMTPPGDARRGFLRPAPRFN
jgi:hypothetical protein